MYPLTGYMLIFVVLASIAGDVTADERICTSQNLDRSTREINELYQKYKSSDDLAVIFLKSVGSGFSLGIQGYLVHMRAPVQSMSKDSADIEGFNSGYHHGLAVYCSMTNHADRNQ
jgi:hypothetical protein